MNKVYQVIANVAKDMSTQGISKGRENKQQGFKFRGIDDVLNALAPSLVRHGLVILPRMVSRTVTERQNKSGGALFYVIVEAEFDFVAAEDGSKHTIRTFGEAMDSGDKATNKAMSAAYKYAAFQAFCIPTEGDNDADATTHEVAKAAPEGYQDWLDNITATADEGTETLKQTWAASPAEYRAFIPKETWEAIKARAAKVAA